MMEESKNRLKMPKVKTSRSNREHDSLSAALAEQSHPQSNRDVNEKVGRRGER